MFISFEGGEGSGKSTQVGLLQAALEKRGREVIRVREPGGTPLGEEVRRLLLDGGSLAPSAEVLLFAASRAQLVGTVIRPALERGAVVLSDRFLDSSLAYQGVARGLGLDTVRSANQLAVGKLTPHLTVLLDISPEEGLKRAGQRGQEADRMEAEAVSFHEMVRNAFLGLAAAEPERFLVCDATIPVEALHRKIVAAFDAGNEAP